MGNVFFISDTHFQHKNVLKYEAEFRNFSSIEEHDEFLIENWNRTVNKKDKVFHLGDFAFKDLSIADRLNGLKTLILGNHDKFKPIEYSKYFHEIHGVLSYKGFVLSHCPVHESDSCLRHGMKNIHGHLHSKDMDDPRYINVSAEAINLTPISFDEIVKINRQC